MQVIRAVLSGSFHKNQSGLQRAYDELVACNVQVLSPHRLDFENTEVLFVRDKAEKGISEETLERHHLLSIHQSDFLWVQAHQGYIGVSTAFEIGYAVACRIPIFSTSLLDEPNISPFVKRVSSVYEAILQLQTNAK
jgi:nucleoside 2-deoxyribosyltransferase